MEEVMPHKNTHEAQREIDAVLDRAELWRSYRPLDGALVSDHAELDLDEQHLHADDHESASIRLFQPKREEPVYVPSVEYEELRAMWREVVRTATMLCTSAVCVMRHGLARLSEVVSAYAHTLEQRTPAAFVFAGRDIPVVGVDKADFLHGSHHKSLQSEPLSSYEEGKDDGVAIVTPSLTPTLPPQPPMSIAHEEVTTGMLPQVVVRQETPDGAVRSVMADLGERGEGVTNGSISGYRPFSRPIKRSGREIYARFREAYPEQDAFSQPSVQSEIATERIPYTEDHADTMLTMHPDDTGETVPLAQSDVGISSSPIAQQRRPRVWREAWRIVFSELFGGLTQK